MTLSEAIRHAEEVAESKRKQVENGDWEKGSPTERDCIECAEEHRQLAEWLKELKELRMRYSQLRRDCNETIDVIGKLRDELKAYREQSGDAISRQAVLDIINFENKWLLDAKGHNADTGIAFSGMKSRIADLPSVSSQQRTGQWIGEAVLDKIRAEIERKAHSGQWSDATMYGMLKAIAIIDKYKAESEVQE